MKVGILFPLSKSHPGVGPDFMDGLIAYLKYSGQEGSVTFFKESIGFGGTEKEVGQKGEKLLMSDDVDILVAYIDEKVLSILHPIVQATGKLMIVVNPGANYLVNWIAQPTIIHLNLQHAFLCWLAGAMAAKKGNGKAALATTFYDCGYLHCASMVNNFLKKGGDIRYNYINNQAYDAAFEISQLTEFLAGNPDCENLLCLFDEYPASLFYHLLNLFKPEKPLHLFVSPMMLQEKALDKMDNGYSFSIEGFLPWRQDIENTENGIFMGACKRPASMFSLLGWETAMIIGRVIKECNDELSNGAFIVSHLIANTLNSPRGLLKLDPETLFYLAPAENFRLNAGSVTPEIQQVAELDTAWHAFTAETIEGPITGWTNTYLCY